MPRMEWMKEKQNGRLDNEMENVMKSKHIAVATGFTSLVMVIGPINYANSAPEKLNPTITLSPKSGPVKQLSARHQKLSTNCTSCHAMNKRHPNERQGVSGAKGGRDIAAPGGLVCTTCHMN